MMSEAKKAFRSWIATVHLPDYPKKCPKCGGKVKIYHLNLANDVTFMCSKKSCSWPCCSLPPEACVGKSDVLKYAQYLALKEARKLRKAATKVNHVEAYSFSLDLASLSIPAALSPLSTSPRHSVADAVGCSDQPVSCASSDQHLPPDENADQEVDSKQMSLPQTPFHCPAMLSPLPRTPRRSQSSSLLPGHSWQSPECDLRLPEGTPTKSCHLETDDDGFAVPPSPFNDSLPKTPFYCPIMLSPLCRTPNLGTPSHGPEGWKSPRYTAMGNKTPHYFTDFIRHTPDEAGTTPSKDSAGRKDVQPSPDVPDVEPHTSSNQVEEEQDDIIMPTMLTDHEIAGPEAPADNNSVSISADLEDTPAVREGPGEIPASAWVKPSDSDVTKSPTPESPTDHDMTDLTDGEATVSLTHPAPSRLPDVIATRPNSTKLEQSLSNRLLLSTGLNINVVIPTETATSSVMLNSMQNLCNLTKDLMQLEEMKTYRSLMRHVVGAQNDVKVMKKVQESLMLPQHVTLHVGHSKPHIDLPCRESLLDVTRVGNAASVQVFLTSDSDGIEGGALKRPVSPSAPTVLPRKRGRPRKGPSRMNEPDELVNGNGAQPHVDDVFLSNPEAVRSFKNHLNIMLQNYDFPTELAAEGIDPIVAMLVHRMYDPLYSQFNIEAILQLYGKLAQLEMSAQQQQQPQPQSNGSSIRTGRTMKKGCDDQTMSEQPTSTKRILIKQEFFPTGSPDPLLADSVNLSSIHPGERSVSLVPDRLKTTSGRVGHGNRVITGHYNNSYIGEIYVSTEEEVRAVSDLIQQKVSDICERYGDPSGRKRTPTHLSTASIRARSILSADVVRYIDHVFTKKGLKLSVVGRKKRNYPKRKMIIKKDPITGLFVKPNLMDDLPIVVKREAANETDNDPAEGDEDASNDADESWAAQQLDANPPTPLIQQSIDQILEQSSVSSINLDCNQDPESTTLPLNFNFDEQPMESQSSVEECRSLQIKSKLAISSRHKTKSPKPMVRRERPSMTAPQPQVVTHQVNNLQPSTMAEPEPEQSSSAINEQISVDTFLSHVLARVQSSGLPESPADQGGSESGKVLPSVFTRHNKDKLQTLLQRRQKKMERLRRHREQQGKQDLAAERPVRPAPPASAALLHLFQAPFTKARPIDGKKMILKSSGQVVQYNSKEKAIVGKERERPKKKKVAAISEEERALMEELLHIGTTALNSGL